MNRQRLRLDLTVEVETFLSPHPLRFDASLAHFSISTVDRSEVLTVKHALALRAYWNLLDNLRSPAWAVTVDRMCQPGLSGLGHNKAALTAIHQSLLSRFFRRISHPPPALMWPDLRWYDSLWYSASMERSSPLDRSRLSDSPFRGESLPSDLSLSTALTARFLD